MDNAYNDTTENVNDLKNEINHLKEKNIKTRKNLMWKIRKLEKEKLEMEMEKNRDRIEFIGLHREIKLLKEKIDKYRNSESVRNTLKVIRNDDYLIAYSQYMDNGKTKDLILIMSNEDKYGLLFHC